MKYKIQRLQQRVDWLEKGLNNIYQDLMDGKIDKDGYAMKRWSYLKENDYLVSS